VNPHTVAVGNPKLKPEHANNYDLLFEQYLHPLGMIQAGFFFKQLTAPQVITSGGSDPLYPGDTVTQYINGQNAYLYGIETSYQQHWSRLPGLLKGLGVSANYTYTNSKEKGIPGRPGSIALQRQTPQSWNLSPTYDTKRVSLRVGYNYSGSDIYSYNWTPGADPSGLGPNGPSGDTHTMPHQQLDAQGSVHLGGGFTFMAYGLNLQNSVFGYYTGSSQFINQREYYKPTYGGGLRYTFGQER
jgi:TonB-dependent receptor